jgi:hypothetical protein
MKITPEIHCNREVNNIEDDGAHGVISDNEINLDE